MHGGEWHSADISYFSQVALRPGRPSRENQGTVHYSGKVLELGLYVSLLCKYLLIYIHTSVSP